MTPFAANLTFLCEQQATDLEALAETVGIQMESLEEMASGETEPSLDELTLLSDALNCSIDRLLTRDLRAAQDAAAKDDIRLLLLDVDGTLTDGGMVYTEHGDHGKRFHVKDGLAIARINKRSSTLKVGIITNTQRTEAVWQRAQDLGITLFYAGNERKIVIADKWLAELGLTYAQVAYCGDDLNDLELMRRVGLAACPADAVRQIKAVSHVVLQQCGGDGCVRELIEDVMGIDIEALAAKPV